MFISGNSLMVFRKMCGNVTRVSMTNVWNNVGKFLMLLITVACVLTIDISHGSRDNRHAFLHKREKRTVRGQQSSQGNDISNSLESYTHINWIQYTPTTPSPDEVNCYVEVPETRLVGGKCVNLGRNTGCQAGIYLAFSEECQNIPTTTRGRSRTWSRSSIRSSRMRRRQARFRRRFGPLLQRTNQ